MRRRRGLTLIELVVALTLGAMVVLMGAQVFRMGLFGREQLKNRASQTTALRRAYEIISRDLHSAVVPPDDSGLQFGSSAGSSAPNSEVFAFASTVGEPLLVTNRAANETSLIRYEVGLDPVTERPTLWRYETPYPVPEGTSIESAEDVRATPLLTGVAEVHYQFLDAAQSAQVDTWEGQPGIPAAVYMTLVLDRSGQNTASRGTTNANAAAESWTFYLPGSKYSADEAAAAAAAEEAASSGTGTGTGAGAGTGAGGGQ